MDGQDEVPRPGVSVVVTNETDTPIDPGVWASLVERVLLAEGVAGPAETNVVFVDTDAIAKLNGEHMGVDGPTDVLSFPIDDAPDEVAGPVRLVGDIVVCPSVAAAQAADHAGTVDDEIALLLVHGALHLLGHDHAEPDERERMWAAEQRLLRAVWRELPATAWSDQGATS